MANTKSRRKKNAPVAVPKSSGEGPAWYEIEVIQSEEQAQILLEEWQRFAAAALQGGAEPSDAAKHADRLLEEMIMRRGVLLASDPEAQPQPTAAS